jgi:hypothetical protein
MLRRFEVEPAGDPHGPLLRPAAPRQRRWAPPRLRRHRVCDPLRGLVSLSHRECLGTAAMCSLRCMSPEVAHLCRLGNLRTVVSISGNVLTRRSQPPKWWQAAGRIVRMTYYRPATSLMGFSSSIETDGRRRILAAGPLFDEDATRLPGTVLLVT